MFVSNFIDFIDFLINVGGYGVRFITYSHDTENRDCYGIKITTAGKPVTPILEVSKEVFTELKELIG